MTLVVLQYQKTFNLKLFDLIGGSIMAKIGVSGKKCPIFDRIVLAKLLIIVRKYNA